MNITVEQQCLCVFAVNTRRPLEWQQNAQCRLVYSLKCIPGIIDVVLYHTEVFGHAALQRPRAISRTFGCWAGKGAVASLRRMYGSRMNTVAVLGELKVAELALKTRGCFQPRRAE